VGIKQLHSGNKPFDVGELAVVSGSDERMQFSVKVHNRASF
jgi:hypothetical protein